MLLNYNGFFTQNYIQSDESDPRRSGVNGVYCLEKQIKFIF